MLKSIRLCNNLAKPNFLNLNRGFSSKLPFNNNNNNNNNIASFNQNNKSLFSSNNKFNNKTLFSFGSVLPMVSNSLKSNIRTFSSSSNAPKENKEENKEEKIKDKKEKEDDDDGIDEKEKLKKLSTGEKIKYMFKKYGKLALIVHFGIYFLTMGGFYILFSSGVDINHALDFLHIPRNAVNPSLGAFAVAFACTKISTVVRTPLTLIIVPLLARYLSRAGKKI
ncbi:hypothetical protein RB653_009389 [Dictyostelium firmibasis]|uniref:DUF1279 domain-containing protein n=1 Tax=Dictyostelium firmibasis TaxID=79012 RepID=A0AAN7U4N6_9MYCE